MKNEEYFQLTLEQRIAREKALSIRYPKKKDIELEYTLADYYETGDSISFLEKLRTYQLNDIMSRMCTSKYKLF